MHQYLVGQGYWSYIEGAQETKLNPTRRMLNMGENNKSVVVLFGVMCPQPHARLHSGSQDAEGNMGEPQEDFRGQHNDTLSRKSASTCRSLGGTAGVLD